MRLCPAIVLLAAAGGCSFIYNPDKITKPVDGREADADLVDAQIDARQVLDADPTMLTIDDVWPKTIYGGQGKFGSPPVNLVIHGHHIVDNVMVTITPSTDLTVGTPVRSYDGDYIVVPVTVAINDNTTAVPLTITVMEPTSGAPSMHVLANKLVQQNLRKLTSGGGLDPATLAATRYSQIDITGDVTFVANAGRVVMTSMSSIHVSGTINAQGGAGTNGGSSVGGSPGPGGCAGGNASIVGGCGGIDGGGGGAATPNGGGGGGYGANGSLGGGGTPFGAIHGDPAIIRYDGVATNDFNQSSGGGGGNAGSLSGAGTGGGGGGTVELDAGGDITLGTVDASGGAGGAGTTFIGLTASGGGGGGSGGLIVLRTLAGTIVGSLKVPGGGGGPKGGSGSAGGDGSHGRIRLDTPNTPPTTTNGVAAHRGPSFAATNPTLVTVPNPMITLVGSDTDMVDMYLVDGAGATHEGEPKSVAFSNGTASVQVSLVDGYNKLCATLKGGMRNTVADTCFELAYLYAP